MWLACAEAKLIATALSHNVVGVRGNDSYRYRGLT